MKCQLFVEIIACLLILLFLYTGVSKFLDFQRFIGEINNQPFPNVLTPFLVWLLPLTEILIALCLMVSITRQAGLWMAFILMFLFTLYTALVLLHVFDRVPCSCGGVIRSLTWKQHLFFNIFFTAIALAGILISKKLQVSYQQSKLIVPQ